MLFDIFSYYQLENLCVKCVFFQVNPIGAALVTEGTHTGSLVCGVCGTVEFCLDLRTTFENFLEEFGTFACTACRQFVVETVATFSFACAKLDCRGGEAACLVRPGGGADSCQACWLLLVLLCCELSPSLRCKLRQLLPDPRAALLDRLARSQGDSTLQAVPNAGVILPCSR